MTIPLARVLATLFFFFLALTSATPSPYAYRRHRLRGGGVFLESIVPNTPVLVFPPTPAMDNNNGARMLWYTSRVLSSTPHENKHHHAKKM